MLSMLPMMIPRGTKLVFSGDYPGLMDNVLNDPSCYTDMSGDAPNGLAYIQDVSALPQYSWTNAQPDDYGASFPTGITPETLLI